MDAITVTLIYIVIVVIGGCVAMALNHRYPPPVAPHDDDSPEAQS